MKGNISAGRRRPVIKPAFGDKIRRRCNYRNRQNGRPRRLKQRESGSWRCPLNCIAEKMLALGFRRLRLCSGCLFNLRTLYREARGETRRKRANGKNDQCDPAPRPQSNAGARVFRHHHFVLNANRLYIARRESNITPVIRLSFTWTPRGRGRL